MTFAPIEDVISAVGNGEMVIMVDDEDRENEGDLILDAETPATRTCGAPLSRSP